MTLEEIIEQCLEDSKKWFPDIAEDLPFIVLCLGGEVGELQNLMKKVMRGTHQYEDLANRIEEEAIDVFIYLMNVFALLGTDVSKEYSVKRNVNAERFGYAVGASGRGVHSEVSRTNPEGSGEVRGPEVSGR